MSVRAFTAIELNDGIKDKIEELIREFRLIQAKSVKYVGREELHLTLKFFGELSVEALGGLSEELKSIRLNVPKIELENAGAFPNVFFPKVIWIGVRQDKNLEDLFHAVDEAAAKFGVEKEIKIFHAHVTIARLKGEAQKGLVEAVRNVKRGFGSFTAESFSLIKSELTPLKPVYSRLQVFPFEKQI